MFYNTKEKIKKYNIIIIPERGSQTKKVSLSNLWIKGMASLVCLIIIVISASIYIFSNRYQNFSQDSMTLKMKNEYIKNLEKENKAKEEKLQDYKVYQDAINDKMEKINDLEKDIKDKLDKSHFLKESNASNDMTIRESQSMAVNMSIQQSDRLSIEAIDDKIKSLMAINEELDIVLEKEQYIPSFIPAKGRITSYFGSRENPFTNRGEENHSAIDIANDYGTEIHATAKGRVVYAEYKGGFGNVVCLDHGNGLTSLYGHASKLLVEPGETVKKGQVIALMGSTGRSTGPHVHFELRKNEVPIDPIRIFE
ncbi:M23 family metallopeptidase [Cellulosilyticum sp. I15G10I2]|uniref:M23 family metallopeptidase n=1 Tax=Cellulosilyticum sp. I15G10I2 TaxID=1892843 RepID=UPI00085C7F94|nr:M23 family metallopeptidase [Cellulosilyticum sp. I15G10I2]